MQIHEHQIELNVQDNGQGIAPDLQPHVFDLFVQAERTPERSQGGVGIGLALVKNLVKLHDGHVDAKNEGTGRGSTFTIRLQRNLIEPDPFAKQKEKIQV